MTTIDEQLVQRIAAQVIQQLADRRDDPARAEIHPAIGTCTGDYRQFTDRPDLTNPSESPMFEGFVTARRLIDSAAQTIRLAPGAKLTPLAVDLVRERKLTVERVGEQVRTQAHTTQATGTFHWWIDGHCDAVRQLAAAQRDRLAPLTPLGQASAIATIIKRLATSMRDGRAAGGILFVQSAARAACFANRCPSLRAVVGTCGDAVQQGIDQLEANVLIVEYPHQGPQAMRAMVRQFIDAPRPTPPDPALAQQLQELATCV